MSTPTAPSPLHAVTEQVESLKALDAPAQALGKQVRQSLSPGTVKDALSGTWLGHALHPVLTDVVIGSFLSASILDVLGGDGAGPAAERLIGVGIAASAPTALTGLTDWSDAEPADDGVRRVGMVHASMNTIALGLYGASLRARRSGRPGRGKALALAGAGVLGAGGYLGGHMSFAQGIGVDQTRFDPGPEEWTIAIPAGELGDEPVTAVVGDTPVMLVRDGGRVLAVHDRCSHRGCLLSGGDIQDGTVTCPCHGSRFSLEDGTVLRGPATADQPAFEAREHDGRIELRRRR